MALECGGGENQAAVSHRSFSLWTNWALIALRALVWSKPPKHIFLGKEEEREQREKLIPKTDLWD